MMYPSGLLRSIQSRPTRGAWIEIAIDWTSAKLLRVAPHAGRVD